VPTIFACERLAGYNSTVKTLLIANILTLDFLCSRAEALVLEGDKVLFAGSRADATALAGPGAPALTFSGCVVPGFIDSHLHFLSFGLSLARFADLLGAQSIADVLGRLSAHAGTWDGPWVQGRGFDQDRLAEGRFPTRRELDAVISDRPAVITRVCGHSVVANSKAIALLTDTEKAAGDPESGRFDETAITALTKKIPPPDDSEQDEAVRRASSVALDNGITSIGTLLDTPEQMSAYARARRQNKLSLRIVGMPPQTSADPLARHGVGTTFGDDFLRFGGAKFFSDGSLGARTALLAAPYADEDRPENLGVRIYDPEVLKARCREVQNHGFQLVIHAIGDQAVRESLDAITFALGSESNDFHRHRIEHASLLPPELLERMAKKKILAVVQPQFVLSDTWTGARVGSERARWAYPFKTMLEAGIPLALSSDSPVERLDSRACLAAAVGRHPWSPEETLTPLQALTAYCHGSAYALHQEEKLGTLAPGKYADFVVLDRDPTNLSAAEIQSLKIEAVFVAGQRVR
jgi:predicted amidohydrolase YtcJ